jgi:hypothetical protein
VAGKLLFSIGACDDAIKAYNYSPNIDKKSKSLIIKDNNSYKEPNAIWF